MSGDPIVIHGLFQYFEKKIAVLALTENLKKQFVVIAKKTAAWYYDAILVSITNILVAGCCDERPGCVAGVDQA